MAGFFLLLSLCVLPAAIVVSMIVRETRTRRDQRRHLAAFARLVPAARLQPAPRAARSQMAPTTAPAASATPHATFIPRPRSNHISPGDFVRAAFEFTIKRHPAVRRRTVTDQGGFAQVPILIHDRHGTSFLTHRRICLN
ncbi:MAG: hypothetical protein R3247_06050 [Rhodothermales bacterium]|nr:hypothetical protein [Rhodothermales bacterium]